MEELVDKPRPKRSCKFLRWLLWIVGSIIALIAMSIAILVLFQPARAWLATRLLTDSIVNGKLAGIPTRTEPQPVRHEMVRMRDGVKLSTHVYLPQGQGPWPVIVVRDPYGFVQYISCKVFVQYDYACVHQDSRGRGDSQGTWYPFVDERDDGNDTIAWILRQPWQDGHLAMHGGSYVGVVQWAASGDFPREVKTFVPTVAHGDVYQLAYRNGMFMEGLPGAWLHSQFQPVTRMLTSYSRWRKRVAGHFPANGVDPAEFGPAWEAYQDYIRHPDKDDPYWQSPQYVALREAHKNVSVPVFMIGYANDFFLPGMIQTFEELPTRDESVLVIGPGNHGGQPEPEVAGQYNNEYADTLGWFDHYLKGAEFPESLRPGISVYVHGDDSWRHFDSWPEPSRVIELNLDRLADAKVCDGGALAEESPAVKQEAQYVYDPRDPVPTLGGAFALIDAVAPTAVEEQGNEICSRGDVLSFSSAPLPDTTLVMGAIRIKLLVASNAADTSFTVKLSEHFSDGRVYNIRDDISTLSMRNGATHRMSYEPGEEVEIEFDLTPIAWQLQEGSRLRLDVSSSSAPAFFPHPNRAGLWSEVREPVVAKQTLLGGSLKIPLVGEEHGN